MAPRGDLIARLTGLASDRAVRDPSNQRGRRILSRELQARHINDIPRGRAQTTTDRALPRRRGRAGHADTRRSQTKPRWAKTSPDVRGLPGPALRQGLLGHHVPSPARRSRGAAGPAPPAHPHPARRCHRRGGACRRSVGSPGGISPPGSHGTEREPLGSLRSSHLSHWNVPVHCQCANRGRFLASRPSHHRFARLNGASRRYFFRAQRTR
jgi:hypothetical protein